MSHEWRDIVVAEAYAWLKTPYHHAANIKGVAVDCCMLLVEVFKVPGIVEPTFDPRPYPKDWMLHRGEEIFINGLFKYAKKIEQPQPADVAMYRRGRTACHGAIIVSDALMIHADSQCGHVVLCEIEALRPYLDSYWTVK